MRRREEGRDGGRKGEREGKKSLTGRRINAKINIQCDFTTQGIQGKNIFHCDHTCSVMVNESYSYSQPRGHGTVWLVALLKFSYTRQLS